MAAIIAFRMTQFHPKFVISFRYRFLYWEVPKSATRTLLEYFVYNPAMNYQARRHVGPRLYTVRKSRAMGHFWFSFVRNPWSRVVSAYLNKIVNYHDPLRPGEPGIFAPGLTLETTFDEFVEITTAIADPAADIHIRSQSSFVRPECFVGKLENFENDFNYVLDRLRLPKHPVPLVNDTKYATDWREFYDRRTWDLVGQRYKEDIERFNYKP